MKTLSMLPVALLLSSGCMADPSDEPLDEEIGVDQAEIFGSDACKDVDFHITNDFEVSGSARRIKVLSLEIYSASEGRWITEDLVNLEIPSGQTEHWFNEDLQYLENDLITQYKVHFRYVEFDGDWSDATARTINTPDARCSAGQDVDLTVL